MDPLAAEPDAAALDVEPDQPITVCPWSRGHRALSHKRFRSPLAFA
jgi:hypothetical protein